ncbi:peptidase, S41 family [alpha proteobacterium U9-1i]|nr:peptidase, S41 family [alpha proteobacterium U9-1i]
MPAAAVEAAGDPISAMSRSTRTGVGMRRRAILAGLGYSALAPNAWAQSELRGRDTAGDIAILREAFEALHPGLYRYASPEAMNGRFAALEQTWARDQTRAAAYLSLSRFLASIQCGHTYANFYNQRRTVAEELFAGRNRLPFHFAWLDERMIVLRNHSGEARLAPGTQVLSINGRSSRRVLRDLVPLMRADGGNDDKRRALLEVRGIDRFESFDIFYPLAFPNQAANAFALRVRTPDGLTHRLEVAPIDLAARRAQMATLARADNAPAWSLTYPNPRSAVLTMPTWALYNSSWDWRGFLDSAFAEIDDRAIARLIVDLRGNEGGLDCGHEIIARLIDRDLPLAAYERRVRFRTTPGHLNPYLDTWDDSFRTLGEGAEPLGNGSYRLPASAETRAIAPKGPRFRGELTVLIDAANSSATFQFADLIRSHSLGRLFGTATGGNKRGINGGAFFFLRLPASGLEADLPLIGTFPLAAAPNSGIAPDVWVVASVEDIALGRDPVMGAALA